MDTNRQPNDRIDPNHEDKRNLLRILGVMTLVPGLCFMAVGLFSFFRAFSTHEPPTQFWCMFVGMPLVALGTVLLKAGFLGAAARYFAGEAAPVAKDTFNYVATESKEGVRNVAQAVTEGIVAGKSGAGPGIQCAKCNEANEPDAKFCKECGTPLGRTKPCPACKELNSQSAKFCDHCGNALV
jgi:hypothetical protein